MNKIQRVLVELNIAPNFKGFTYISNGIELIVNSETMIPVCKIYEMIAEKFNDTPIRVERNIRHAFSKMNRDSDEFKKYIGIKSGSSGSYLYALALNFREENNDGK